MPRVIVYHTTYGCETGCCGHAVQLDDKQYFEFTHPYGEDIKQFVKDLVIEKFGEEHVADIDWDNCVISDD